MLETARSPFIKTREKIWGISSDVLIVCAFMLIQAVANYGVRPLIITALSVVSCVLVEILGNAIFKNHNTLGDLMGIKSGVLLAMILSPAVPFWFPILGGVIAGIVRWPFLNKGASPFIPAAVSASVLTVAFPNIMFSYISPGGIFSPIMLDSTQNAVKSTAGWLMDGRATPFTYLEEFLGIVPGTIGSSLIALCLCGLLYLILRKAVNWVAAVSFILECLLIATAFPRGDYGMTMSALNEIMAGSLVFCGIFFIGDKYTSPKHWGASLIYGLIAGTVCMLLRYAGFYEEVCWFVVVVMGIIAPLLDQFIWKLFKN